MPMNDPASADATPEPPSFLDAARALATQGIRHALEIRDPEGHLLAAVAVDHVVAFIPKRSVRGVETTIVTTQGEPITVGIDPETLLEEFNSLRNVGLLTASNRHDGIETEDDRQGDGLTCLGGDA